MTVASLVLAVAAATTHLAAFVPTRLTAFRARVLATATATTDDIQEVWLSPPSDGSQSLGASIQRGEVVLCLPQIAGAAELQALLSAGLPPMSSPPPFPSLPPTPSPPHGAQVLGHARTSVSVPGFLPRVAIDCASPTRTHLRTTLCCAAKRSCCV